jgi:hypothetical protein
MKFVIIYWQRRQRCYCSLDTKDSPSDPDESENSAGISYIRARTSMLSLGKAPPGTSARLKDVCGQPIQCQHGIIKYKLSRIPTLGLHLRRRIVLLEQEDFILSLLTEIVPTQSWGVQNFQCFSNVITPHIIDCNQKRVINRASIADSKRPIFN